MSDSYKHDKAEVSTLINKLIEIRTKYISKIDTLKLLVEEISTSNSWIDNAVKQEFVNTCNSYITLYNDGIAKMELYEKYLSFKSGKMSDVEDKHTLEGVKYEF